MKTFNFDQAIYYLKTNLGKKLFLTSELNWHFHCIKKNNIIYFVDKYGHEYNYKTFERFYNVKKLRWKINEDFIIVDNFNILE